MIKLAHYFEQSHPDAFEIYAQIELYTRKRNEKELTELFSRNARWFEKSALLFEEYQIINADN